MHTIKMIILEGKREGSLAHVQVLNGSAVFVMMTLIIKNITLRYYETERLARSVPCAHVGRWVRETRLVWNLHVAFEPYFDLWDAKIVRMDASCANQLSMV